MNTMKLFVKSETVDFQCTKLEMSDRRSHKSNSNNQIAKLSISVFDQDCQGWMNESQIFRSFGRFWSPQWQILVVRVIPNWIDAQHHSKGPIAQCIVFSFQQSTVRHVKSQEQAAW